MLVHYACGLYGVGIDKFWSKSNYAKTPECRRVVWSVVKYKLGLSDNVFIANTFNRHPKSIQKQINKLAEIPCDEEKYEKIDFYFEKCLMETGRNPHLFDQGYSFLSKVI